MRSAMVARPIHSTRPPPRSAAIALLSFHFPHTKAIRRDMQRPGKPKKKGSAFKRNNASTNPDRKVPKKSTPGQGRIKGTTLRTKSSINRLNMYRGGHAIRNKKGRIVHGGAYNDKNSTGGKIVKNMGSAVARTAPNRRWFGNTRIINPKQLDKFREEMGAKVNDPYTVVLRTRKLPMGLLSDTKKTAQMNLLSTESFESVFGPKAQRKRPKCEASGLQDLVERANKKAKLYDDSSKVDRDEIVPEDGTRTLVRNSVFEKGQSRRIWGELYKVLDCSDIVVQVLDVRNPMGTRSKNVESHLKKNARHKHLVFVLNKCDLVPIWVTRRWVAILSKEYPTLAFHASINNPFGKGALINLLRQFSQLHQDKKQISVGFIGYPNVGKSSVINTLKKKKVCKAAPVPGETKIWQYITLMKRVFLIDCPGVVPPTDEEEATLVLRGVTRSERLPYPENYVPPILAQVKREYIVRTYGVHGWTDSEDFLNQIAIKTGRLLKGGEADIGAVAKQVINDWQRGRLPWFKPPPEDDQPKEITMSSAVESSNGSTVVHKADKRSTDDRNDKSTNNGGAAVVGPSLPSDAKGNPKKPNYISAEPSNATIPDLPRIVQDLGKLAHREGLASSTIDRTHEDGGSGAGKKRTIGEGDEDELQWEDLQFEM